MPKKSTKSASSEEKLNRQATQIAAEIFSLINQYTNDSSVSKFFLPEDVSETMYVTAGGFASNVYTPQLEIENIKKANILPFFLVLITYGFQIYVKERSIKTKASPYRLPTDKRIIAMTSDAILTKAVEGDVISSPLADKIIAIILDQVAKNVDYAQYKISGYELDQERVTSYSTVALYYGYNLASVLINKTKS